MRYFDPSYQIRSSPANAADSILCDLYARNAVYAAMAGKTGLVIGYLHDAFIHIPIEMLVLEKKRIDPAGFFGGRRLWRQQDSRCDSNNCRSRSVPPIFSAYDGS
jgi:6-phosphofructokinase